jgi:hypothetical protein
MIDRPHAGFGRHSLLCAGVDFAGGIVTQEHHGETRDDAVVDREAADRRHHPCPQLGGDCFAVDQGCGHGAAPPFDRVWTGPWGRSVPMSSHGLGVDPKRTLRQALIITVMGSELIFHDVRSLSDYRSPRFGQNHLHEHMHMNVCVMSSPIILRRSWLTNDAPPVGIPVDADPSRGLYVGGRACLLHELPIHFRG